MENPKIKTYEFELLNSKMDIMLDTMEKFIKKMSKFLEPLEPIVYNHGSNCTCQTCKNIYMPSIYKSK